MLLLFVIATERCCNNFKLLPPRKIYVTLIRTIVTKQRFRDKDILFIAGMWILLAIVLFTLVFLGLRKRYARFSQFKGISPLQFFFLKNVHYRITALRKEKLVCLHTPAFSFVLATHPDSAKVEDYSWLLINFTSINIDALILVYFIRCRIVPEATKNP